MDDYVVINFSQYPQFVEEFTDHLEEILNAAPMRSKFSGATKADIFKHIMREKFDADAYALPDEPFWIAHIARKDAVNFLLKYS